MNATTLGVFITSVAGFLGACITIVAGRGKNRVDVASTVQEMAFRQAKELEEDLKTARFEVAELRSELQGVRNELSHLRAWLAAQNIPYPSAGSK